MREEITVIKNTGWKRNTLIIGAVVGLFVGAGAAYLFIQQHEANGQPPEFSAGDGVKLGVMVMGLMRGIASM